MKNIYIHTYTHICGTQVYEEWTQLKKNISRDKSKAKDELNKCRTLVANLLQRAFEDRIKKNTQQNEDVDQAGDGDGRGGNAAQQEGGDNDGQEGADGGEGETNQGDDDVFSLCVFFPLCLCPDYAACISADSGENETNQGDTHTQTVHTCTHSLYTCIDGSDVDPKEPKSVVEVLKGGGRSHIQQIHKYRQTTNPCTHTFYTCTDGIEVDTKEPKSIVGVPVEVLIGGVHTRTHTTNSYLHTHTHFINAQMALK
jgi:hypothetical protein